MPQIDLSILNQRQTPAFYADVLANRPAAGFIGRIFVSTNTFEFYRDNGTTWDLIGGPGAGTITGSGTAGQVTYWNGASTVTGSNNLFYDTALSHLGINTNTPGSALDVHDDQSTLIQLNQTVATNDTRIGFQNSGVALWRIGNFYNAGANDWGIFDVVGAAQPLTIKKTTGQVLIGTSTVGSGKLVVASATGDNGVQIVGASAPSLRIDNAESGPTKRAGLGIATATNNFIQGSADRDFCIFNGSTTAASPMLFGIYDAGLTNVQEAARISAARNFLVGKTSDTGEKLQVVGASKFTPIISVDGTASVSPIIAINALGAGNNNQYFDFRVSGSSKFQFGYTQSASINRFFIYNAVTANDAIRIIETTNNILINTPTDAGFKLDVNGTARVQDNFNIAKNQNAVTRVDIINTTSGTSAFTEYKLSPSVLSGSASFGKYSTTTTSYKIILANDSYIYNSTLGDINILNDYASGIIKFAAGGSATAQMTLSTNGNLLIGTATNGASKLRIVGLPTSAAGLSSGDVYSNLGVLTIVP